MFRPIGRLNIGRVALWSWRLVFYGVLGSVIVLAGSILGLRYWVLPNIAAYRGDLEQALGRATGQRIGIGELHAQWDGLRPHFTLGRVVVHDAQGRPALELERVDAALAWTSLVFLEPRFHSVEIHRPDLAIRRARDGTISVAGIEVKGGEEGSRLTDWVLRQPRLTITRASVSWLDEQRAAPELKLERVSVRLRNDFFRHRLGVQATGPADAFGTLDLRADLAGNSVEKAAEWEGQLYIFLDWADLAAYKQWVSIPLDVARGHGALRMWLDIDNARVRSFTADVHLAQLEARLAPELEPLRLDEVSGRIGWHGWNGGFDVSASGLAVAAPEGHGFKPLDIKLRMLEARGGKPARGELKASELDLAALAHFAAQLPVDAPIREALGRHAPRGRVSGLSAKWSGDWPPEQYEVKARVDGLGMAASGDFPGVANLSGSIEANDKRGSLTLANRDTRLELPKAFAEPLAFDALAGQVSWTVNAGRYDIRFGTMSFTNADLEGTLSGGFQAGPQGKLVADLSGVLTRAEARRIYHYLPLKVSKSTRAWVQKAVIDGRSSDVRWRLKGDLKDFPFDRSKGVFEVVAKGQAGVLDYADGWPRIENIAAEVRFSANRMEVRSGSATIYGAQLSRVLAVIDDLNHDFEVLEVSGEAEGATAEFVRFVASSPLAQKVEPFMDAVEAQGRGKLALKLTLPLRALAESRAAGSYQFIANRLKVDAALPPLENVDGRIEFTEAAVRSPGLSAQVFGGPASIHIATQGDAVAVNASGKASMDALRKTVDSPWLQALSGAADWRSQLYVRGKSAEFVIESGLQGIASNLPAPLAKAAADTVALRVERRMGASGQDEIHASWGPAISARFERRREGAVMTLERAAIGFGVEPPAAEGPGVWLRGALPRLDIDRWRALLAELGPAANAPSLAGLDLKIGMLDVFGRRFNDVALSGRQSDPWRLRVSAREVNGEIAWRGPDRAQLSARLQRLALPAIEQTAPGEARPPAPSDYPALDIVVEEFSYKDRALGRLELTAVPDGRDWRVERLTLRNPDASFSADGVWQWQARVPRTQMNLRLETGDIGKLLARLRYPEGIRGGIATLGGTLAWNGRPEDIDFASLSGNLMIDASRGQFLKLDPGIGKLLAILSLQALPRRVTLDFKDIFSEGFAFDSIQGQLKIQRGIASTDNFRIVGSSARVLMSGDVDLAREAQSLRVRVTPSLGDSVATVTALLGGPIAGIGVFLAQKLLNDPLGQLIAYDYAVTGTWSDPVVNKLAFERPAPG